MFELLEMQFSTGEKLKSKHTMNQGSMQIRNWNFEKKS